jgi:hypothetical protein
LSFVNYISKAGSFCCENAAPERSEAVIAAARVIVSTAVSKFLHPLSQNQLLQIVVESPGSQSVLPIGLASDFLHDAVAVEVLPGKREQNVQGSGR